MCGQVLHRAGFGLSVTHDRMHGLLGLHSLHVSIRPRVEVRPADVGRVAVIGRGDGAGKVVRVKNVGGADRSQLADGATEVHVVAGNHQSAAARAKPQNSGTIGIVETIAGIDRKQP